MHQLRRWGPLLALVLTLSGCSHPLSFGIDIIEHAHFRPNGSGKFSLIIDLKKCRTFISLAKYISRRHAGLTQAILRRAFRRTKLTLKQVVGVSQVNAAHDPELLYFKISFHFQNIQALNRAMQAMHAYVDQPGVRYFHLDGHSFARVDPQGTLKLIERYHQQDNSCVASFDLRTFFRSATYTTSYLFDRRVKSVSHPQAKLSRSRKRVVVEHCLFCPRGRKLSVRNKVMFHTSHRS